MLAGSLVRHHVAGPGIVPVTDTPWRSSLTAGLKLF